MLEQESRTSFAPLNAAYDRVLQPNRLSVGLVMPVENHMHSAVPTLTRHLQRAQLAEQLGFAALWLRDVPFNVPSFGDAGQTFDPFVYLGLLAGQTRQIALGVASLILPLRHPAHVAKAAASVDVLSGGRLLLGVASGDRPEEYPALDMPYHDRGLRFRESYAYIRNMAQERPDFENAFGRVGGGIDMLPKPTRSKLALLITGGSQQSPDWLARNGDGWITYPRNVAAQAQVVQDYRARLAVGGQPNKPVIQSLYIDLVENDDAPPKPIHLGFQSGAAFLCQYLSELRTLGINHVALNLRFNQSDPEQTLKRLAKDVLPGLNP